MFAERSTSSTVYCPQAYPPHAATRSSLQKQSHFPPHRATVFYVAFPILLASRLYSGSFTLIPRLSHISRRSSLSQVIIGLLPLWHLPSRFSHSLFATTAGPENLSPPKWVGVVYGSGNSGPSHRQAILRWSAAFRISGFSHFSVLLRGWT